MLWGCEFLSTVFPWGGEKKGQFWCMKVPWLARNFLNFKARPWSGYPAFLEYGRCRGFHWLVLEWMSESKNVGLYHMHELEKHILEHLSKWALKATIIIIFFINLPNFSVIYHIFSSHWQIASVTSSMLIVTSSLSLFHWTDTLTAAVDTATVASVIPKKRNETDIIYFLQLKPSV